MLEVKVTKSHLKNWYLSKCNKFSDKVKCLAQHTVVYITPWFRTNGPSAIQEIPLILLSLKVHYRIILIL
jgi:hypothetical protein